MLLYASAKELTLASFWREGGNIDPVPSASASSEVFYLMTQYRNFSLKRKAFEPEGKAAGNEYEEQAQRSSLQTQVARGLVA